MYQLTPLTGFHPHSSLVLFAVTVLFCCSTCFLFLIMLYVPCGSISCGRRVRFMGARLRQQTAIMISLPLCLGLVELCIQKEILVRSNLLCSTPLCSPVRFYIKITFLDVSKHRILSSTSSINITLTI